MRFCDIEFGLNDADNELSYADHLLKHGFIDAHNAVNDLLHARKFLVLGSKGSGKTAIGSKLETLSEEDECLFVKKYNLGTFEYQTFTSILDINEADEIKLPIQWEFILLISLIDSFVKDRQCTCLGDVDYESLILSLKNSGLLPNPDLKQIISMVSSKGCLAGLKGYLSANYSTECKVIPLDNKMLLKTVREACYSINTPSKHILVLDGLDDVITNQENQKLALYGLITAADIMNKEFSKNKVPAKVIVLCRDDIFEDLPGANLSKIRSDSSITLDWYQDTRDFRETNLIKLVNKRASYSLNRTDMDDIFTHFLPEYIPHDRLVIKLILENTRHRPRDLVSLMNQIQRHNRTRNPDSKPTINDIWNGLRTYSREYFRTEIENELYGFITEEDRRKVLQLLGNLHMAQFTYEDICEIKNSNERFSHLNLEEILTKLFKCGAIGNFHWHNGNMYFTFAFRNPGIEFDPHQGIVIHKGLRKGLGIE